MLKYGYYQVSKLCINSSACVLNNFLILINHLNNVSYQTKKKINNTVMTLTSWIAFSVIIVVTCSVYFKYLSISANSRSNDFAPEQFVNSYGYSLNSYQALTKDGYVLTLHRIPGRIGDENSNEKANKPPVFLMHGIVCTSFDWVILGNKSMAFILADAGYDVWIGNNRGNTYSRNHLTLNPDVNLEFWEYSFNEIGVFDLPAMIDKVLEVTGKNQLTYVGYSEGFTSFLVMGSRVPHYNEKIKSMHAFAPVTDMYQVKSPMLKAVKVLCPILRIFNKLELMTLREFSEFIKIVLEVPFIGPSVVRYFVHLVGGSYHQLDLDFMKDIFQNFPGGVSLRQLEHYVQTSETGNFRPYDNRLLDKLWETDYDLSKVKAQIFLYYGQDDYLVNNEILLKQVVPQLNIVKALEIPEKTFNHVDFIWGNNITFLTSEALRNINEYN